MNGLVVHAAVYLTGLEIYMRETAMIVNSIDNSAYTFVFV